MKKLFLIAAVASMGLASCVNEMDELGTLDESQNQITFTTPVVSPNSRSVVGEIDGNKYSVGETFNVFARYSKETYQAWGTEGNIDYMKDVVVSHSGNTWKPAQPYFWPKEGYLTFAAYSPTRANEAGTIAYGATGFTFTNFAIAANGYNSESVVDNVQYDLMYSLRTYNKQESTGKVDPSYDGVDINFQHALSSVKFTVKTEFSEGAPSATNVITLNGIKLLNVKCKGNFAETITDGPTYDAAPAWTPAEDVAEYTVFTGNVDITNIDLATAVTELTTKGFDFILMPQDFSTSDAQIQIEYTIKNPNNVELKQTTTKKLSELGFSTGGANEAKWLMGYRYTYNITISPKTIFFSPEVEKWTDTTAGGDVTI